MHEIVTIQLGKQSNFVGTHFWNAQESYFTYGGDQASPIDHDIHFKAGVGADGSDTFTPRTVIYDLKSNFGTLRQVNALYELQNEGAGTSGLWATNPPTILQHQAPINAHSYQQQLESGVAQPEAPTKESIRFWSDYNRVFYHPRSLIQIRENATTLGSQLGSLEAWSTGGDLAGSLEKEHGETLVEKDIRPFLEECDQLQGIQLYTGVDDAWGGFANLLMEELRDEIGKGSIWVWGLEDWKERPQHQLAPFLANTAFSLQRIASQASLYIPLANIPTRKPGYLSLDFSCQWHTSALQSAIIESVTLPSRLRPDTPERATLAHMEAVFGAEGRQNIVEAALSAKSGDDEQAPTNGLINGQSQDHRMANGHDYDGADDDDSEPLDMDLTRYEVNVIGLHSLRAPLRHHTFAEVRVQRGTWPSPWSTDPLDERDTTSMTRQLHRSTQLFPQPSSFPPIFHFSEVGGARLSTAADSSLPIQASLSATTNIANRLRSLAMQVSRVQLVGREDREELYSDLKSMADEYVEGWDPGSDESGSDEE